MFKPIYVFVYGTLKRGQHNHDVLGDCKFVNNVFTETPDYIMYTGGFPYVVYAPGDEASRYIDGELYLVETEEQMQRLDWLEGVPHHYIHHKCLAASMNVEKQYEAVMYIASPATEQMLTRHPRPLVTEAFGAYNWN